MYKTIAISSLLLSSLALTSAATAGVVYKEHDRLNVAEAYSWQGGSAWLMSNPSTSGRSGYSLYYYNYRNGNQFSIPELPATAVSGDFITTLTVDVANVCDYDSLATVCGPFSLQTGSDAYAIRFEETGIRETNYGEFTEIRSGKDYYNFADASMTVPGVTTPETYSAGLELFKNQLMEIVLIKGSSN